MENYLKIEIVALLKFKQYRTYFIIFIVWLLLLVFLPSTLFFNGLCIVYTIFMIVFYKRIKKYDKIGEILLFFDKHQLIIYNVKYNLEDLDFFEINIKGYANQAKLDGWHLTILSGLTNTIDFSHKGERHKLYFRLKNRKEYKQLKTYLRNED